MAVETVTNYKCDRCGRSEIKDGAKILTLTIRPRANNKPGPAANVISKHVCEQNCLRIVMASMKQVQVPGRYDRSKSKRAKGATKHSTKKPQAPVSVPAKPAETLSASEARARAVKAVRAITRVKGGPFAPGYNTRKERAMIAEHESMLTTDPRE
jgi:hypothetical protein